MKRTGTLFLIVGVLAVLFLAGCMNASTIGNDMTEAPEPDALQTGGISEGPGTAAPITEIKIDYATDEFLGKLAAYDEFIEFDNENYQKIAVTPRVAVKDFRYIEVGHQDDGGNMLLYESKVLYSLDELSPERPFAVTWMEQGLIPHRGIAFTDESGTARYFYLAMSGKDGSIILVEFQNAA